MYMGKAWSENMVANEVPQISWLPTQTQYKWMVTDGNTKLCCRGFILTLSQSTTSNKTDSEHTRDYKRLLWYAKLKYYELQ